MFRSVLPSERVCEGERERPLDCAFMREGEGQMGRLLNGRYFPCT